MTETARSFQTSTPQKLKQFDSLMSSVRYSFPKLRRFESSQVLYPINSSCDKLYEKNSTLSSRAAGLGYGQKVQIGVKSISPGPGQYSVTKSLQKKHPIAMGMGRDV